MTLRNILAAWVIAVAFASSAAAQSTFPTPGGQNVDGVQILCQNAAGKSVACGSGGGGGSVPIVVSPLAYTVSSSATVSTTSSTLVTAGQFKNVLRVCTLPGSTGNVWLNVTGSAATASNGDMVFKGGGCQVYGGPDSPVPTAAVTAITDGGVSQNVTVVGG